MEFRIIYRTDNCVRKMTRRMASFMLFIIICMSIFQIQAKAGDSLSMATEVSIGRQFSGVATHESSYYQFSLNKNSIIKMDLKTDNSDQKIYFTLRDSDGEKIEFYYTEDEYNWGYQSAKKKISLNAGIYYLEIEEATSSESNPKFRFNISVIKQESKTCKIAGTKNDYLKDAQQFKIGNYLKGMDSSYDAGKQYYKFKLNRKRRVLFVFKVPVNSGGTHMSMDLLKKSGKSIEGVFCNDDQGENKGRITKMLKKGTYFIEVGRLNRGNYGEYTIKTSYK